MGSLNGPDDILDELLSELPDGSGEVALRGLPLQTIARELVRDIYPAEDIARLHGLTIAQLNTLANQAGFRKLLGIERAVWDGSENASERAKTYHREGQALAASIMVGWMMDETLPIAARLDAAKLSARIAGIDAAPKVDPANSATPGAVFAVNFHFTDRPSERITTVVPPIIEGSAL